MRLDVHSVVYFYMFICGALLVFNALYIFRSKGHKRSQARKAERWSQELEGELSRLTRDGRPDGRHARLLGKRLKSTGELMAYNEALGGLMSGRGEDIHRYFYIYRGTVRELAVRYAKKSAMERAFFAYLIASYYPPQTERHDMLTEILLTYLDRSTVYCRENVLRALYLLGNAQAVEHAFELLSDREWYHHPRLISDGMNAFTGDGAALVLRLWRHRRQWAEFLVVAVIQYATNLKGADFSREFFQDLENPNLTLEARFALVRYFQRHPYPPAGPVLLRQMEKGGEENGLAVVAASALAAYPGEETERALCRALHSRDWYVRHNAASALVRLGISQKNLDEIRAGGDRYALEMLEYMSEGQEKVKVGVRG